jgi:hypothetical protein
MESPLMLVNVRERMPDANVPLPYGGNDAFAVIICEYSCLFRGYEDVRQLCDLSDSQQGSLATRSKLAVIRSANQTSLVSSQ